MKHGLTGYVRHKCRCDICKAARRESAARTYAKYGDENRAKGRAYAKAHPEEAKARVAKWIAANPERARAMNRAKTKRHADANREHVRERYRRWLAANPEKAKAAYTAYRKANPQKSRDAAKIRRARVQGATIYQVTERDWQRLCARHHHRCAYCGAAGEMHKDHVMPITRGGHHSIGNLLPACKPCNSSKNNRLLSEWRGRRTSPATHVQNVPTRT